MSITQCVKTEGHDISLEGSYTKPFSQDQSLTNHHPSALGCATLENIINIITGSPNTKLVPHTAANTMPLVCLVRLQRWAGILNRCNLMALFISSLPSQQLYELVHFEARQTGPPPFVEREMLHSQSARGHVSTIPMKSKNAGMYLYCRGSPIPPQSMQRDTRFWERAVLVVKSDCQITPD